MKIVPVTQNNFQAAADLLTQNQLPTQDITSDTLLFGLYEENQLLGTVGVDIMEDIGLLRSLCVTDKARKGGKGQLLVDHVEGTARQKGVKELYLLTTTASSFFTNRGYQTVDRTCTPESVKATSQFSTICSKTATIMKKELV